MKLDPHSPARRLQRLRGSRRVSGWGGGQQSEPQDSSSAGAGAAASGEKIGTRPGYLRADTAPGPPQWLHAATGPVALARPWPHSSIPPTSQRAAQVMVAARAAAEPAQVGCPLPATASRNRPPLPGEA